MAQWWQELTLELHIFYALGIASTVILLIQLFMTVIGLDHDAAFDGGVDGGVDGGAFDGGVDGGAFDGGVDGGAFDGAGLHDASAAEHSSGLHVLSTRTIVAFLAGFGWTGVIARTGGISTGLSALAALAVGTVLMFMVYWLMRVLYGLRQSGNVDYRNAIGQVGTVYVRIPAAGVGTGQIQVLVQGRLATVAAVTDGPENITSGRKVKVTAQLSESILKVEAL